MELLQSPAELYAEADLVVMVEATSSEVRWAAGDGGIETVVWLTPLRAVRGDAPDTLELVLPGGRIGEHGVWVEDVPALTVDHAYVLCLIDTPDGWQVLGGEQGVFPVAGEGPGFGLPDILAAMGVR